MWGIKTILIESTLMNKIIAFALFSLLVASPVALSQNFGQDSVDTPKQSVKQDLVEELSNNKFRQSLLKAADSAARKGDLRRLEVVRLRVATLSPAFVQRAQDLAVIQMAFSGEDVPVNDDGKIEVNRIDWEGLIAFLERLIPLILKLIDLFAYIGYLMIQLGLSHVNYFIMMFI
jgi:hypothetical protein